MKEPLCSVWKDLCNINYNYFYSGTKKTEKILSDEFKERLLSHVDVNDVVVVNGGHFIPSKKLSSNALKTWTFACDIAVFLKSKGIKSTVSLLINDLPFTAVERKRLNVDIPQEFFEYTKKHDLEVTLSSLDNKPYREKACANRFSTQNKSKKWQLYSSDIVYDYCVASIIYYHRDIIKQGTTVSVWITPKCSAQHLIDGINLFNENEHQLKTFAYFFTNNCFE